MNWLNRLWAKIKADWLNATALVSALLGEGLSHIDRVFYSLASNLDSIAAALGDPNLNQQMHALVTDVTWFGRWTRFVGAVVIAARFTKLVQSPPKA